MKSYVYKTEVFKCNNCESEIYQCDLCKEYFRLGNEIFCLRGGTKHICDWCFEYCDGDIQDKKGNHFCSEKHKTTHNEKKSLEKQVEILQKTVDGLIDRIIQLEEAVFEGG